MHHAKPHKGLTACRWSLQRHLKTSEDPICWLVQAPSQMPLLVVFSNLLFYSLAMEGETTFSWTDTAQARDDKGWLCCLVQCFPVVTLSSSISFLWSQVMNATDKSEMPLVDNMSQGRATKANSPHHFWELWGLRDGSSQEKPAFWELVLTWLGRRAPHRPALCSQDSQALTVTTCIPCPYLWERVRGAVLFSGTRAFLDAQKIETEEWERTAKAPQLITGI